MSINRLRRRPADENPLLTDKVPSEPLQTEFPDTTSDSDARAMTASVLAVTFVLAVIAGVLPSVVVLQHLSAIWPGLSAAVALATCTVFGMHAHHFRKRFDRDTGCCVLYVAIGTVLVALGLNTQGLGRPSVLLPIGLLTNALTILTFRWHWMHVSTTGWTPKEVARAFRERGAIPKGLRPKWGGFWAAMTSYLSSGVTLSPPPGLVRPCMPLVFRMVAFILPTLLLGLAAADVLSRDTGNYRELESGVADAGGQPATLHVIREELQVAAYLGAGVFVLFSCYVGSWPIAGRGYALFKTRFTPHHWGGFLGTLHSSQNSTEKRSVLIGRVDSDGSPILLPVERFSEAMHIQGAPGSGKTVLLMSLIEQFVELGVSVVVIDNKATSHEMLYSAVAASGRVRKRTGQNVPIWPFTTMHGEATYLYDHFAQGFWQRLSPEQQASVLLNVFGMSYGTTYGESWFGDAAWTNVRHVASKHAGIASWQELSEHFRDEIRWAADWELSKQVREAGEHPRLIIERLAYTDAINKRASFAPEVIDRSINLERLFQEPSVLYCALPAVLDPVGNPEVGRTILSDVFRTAQGMSRSVPTVCIVDEWQKLVSKSLDTVIQQARSSEVGLILANQHAGDLKSGDYDLGALLQSCTVMQAWLRANDIDARRQIVELGGDYIEEWQTTTEGTGTNGNTTSVTTRESIEKRVSTALLDEVAADQSKFFLRINSQSGYAAYGGQMLVARSTYHTTKQEHVKRSKADWVKPRSGMLVNGDHRPPPGAPSAAALTGPSTPPSTNSTKRTRGRGGRSRSQPLGPNTS